MSYVTILYNPTFQLLSNKIANNVTEGLVKQTIVTKIHV